MSEARRITAMLGGRWYGRYGAACCPAHQDTRPSLTITDAPGRLLLHCKAGCGFTDVLTALRWKGVLEGINRMPEPDPAALARARLEAAQLAEKREQQALACWSEAQPIVGTPAEAYLRGRAITCELPATLRYHPSCWHPEARRLGAGRLPAMLARVEGAAHFAIHRTYLRPGGSGKADVQPAKAMLGSTTGGAVCVTFAEEGPLVVAEGIETALSLASGLVAGPATIWAALSTSGMSTLNLPVKPHRLIIATDGDTPGQEAGLLLAERAQAMGWDVSHLPAQQGRDWNDALMLGVKEEQT